MKQIYFKPALIAAFSIFLIPFQSNGDCAGIDFTASTTDGCAPQLIEFNVTGAPQGSHFSWDFGNGSSSTNDETTYRTYSSEGDYDVVLTVTLPDNTGCQPIIKNNYIEIEEAPDLSINIEESTFCEGGGQTTITDQSPNIAERTFLVDGKVYENASASINHNFATSGSKDITLEVTTNSGCQTTETFNEAVNVFDQPNLGFCGNVIQETNGTSATFNPSISGLGGQQIDEYSWSFENGSPSVSNESNPNVTFNSVVGGNDVTLEITTNQGCNYSQTIENAIIDYIDVSESSICANEETTITNKASNYNNKSGFSWFFPGGSIEAGSPNTYFDIKYSSIGEKNINLQYGRSESRCTWNVNFPEAVVVEGPTASFHIDDKIACNPPQDVTFNVIGELPEGENNQITWEVINSISGNPHPGTPLGPTSEASTDFTITQPGSYDVYLQVSSSNGCSDTSSKEFNIVVEDPKPDWEAAKDTFCIGETFTPLNQTSPPDPVERATFPHLYTWIVSHSDSSGISDTTYAKEPEFPLLLPPGDYDVTLAVDAILVQNCTDTLHKERAFHLRGIDGEIVNQSEDFDCQNNTFNFDTEIRYNEPDVADNELTYSWDVETEGAGHVVSFTDPQSVSTGVNIDSNGCFIISNTISNNYECDRVLTKEICAGVVADFEFVPHDIAEYNNKDYPIYCRADSIKIENNSINSPDQYVWSVNNEEEVTISDPYSEEPAFIFNEAGCYDVELYTEREGASGMCTDTIIKEICIRAPKPEFTVNTTEKECAPEIFIFTNNTELDTLNSSNKYLWDFGDGHYEENQNTEIGYSYQVNNPDGFTIKLAAEDEFGCKDTNTQESFVTLEGPVPQFNPITRYGCDSVVTGFENNSEYVDRFMFDYGDGSSPDSFELREHTYKLNDNENIKTFYPTLIAEDTDDCRAFYSDSITVSRRIEAEFQADNDVGCLPHEVQFQATFVDDHVTYQWDLKGDGEIDATGSEISYTYEEPGEYDVTMIAKSGPECIDTMTKESFIKVDETPVADFSVSKTSFCGPGTVEFEHNSEKYTDFIIEYGQNDIVDTNEFRDFQYEFPPDLYGEGETEIEVIFTAYNTYACGDEISKTITITEPPAPEVTISKDTVCANERVNISGYSPSANSWQWDIGIDGQINSTAQNFDYMPLQGTNPVRLIASNAMNCTDTVDIEPGIVSTQSPEAEFSVSEEFLCTDEKTLFTNHSTFFNREEALKWYFDLPNITDTITDSKPDSVLYEEPGTYYPTLLAIDNYGCKDTFSKEIQVLDTEPSEPEEINYVSFKEDSSIIINWPVTEKPRFASYTVEKSSHDEEYEEIASFTNIEDTVHIDSHQIDYEEPDHCYRLITTNQCGTSSIESDFHCPPRLSVDTLTGLSNQLTWEHYNGWQPVIYTIERSVDGGEYEVIDSVNGTIDNYIDEPLCDKKYCYRVIAHSPDGSYTSVSNEDCNNPPYVYQEDPVNLELVSVENNSQIKIAWQEGAQENIHQYIIDRKRAGQNWETEYAFVDESELQYTDREVAVNEEYYRYRVKVEDECGNISPSSNPGTSLHLRGEINDDFPLIYWNPYEIWNNGVLRYDVEIRDDNQAFNHIGNASGEDTSYIDNEIHENVDTAYCYRVTAVEDDANPALSVSNVRCLTLPSRIYVPNAFSPNDDNVNDEFLPQAISVHNEIGDEHLEYQLTIYNRWGAKLFETNDLNEGWDGRLENGDMANEGVYVYEIRARGIDYQVIHRKGSVLLLR